ncbi:DUF4355 domain-containing protein [Staphylococcus sp. IVB6238]|uniref:DUF4355 domain-containing protein n=1 Tax=Staphylococcus sp. IVB6238 TaxID=2989770 RepID=UPI0021D05639|nr:DUF4355 domain-containing protein [Staphylococcus sp. IVB6238]UXR73304.1 DUF4355 domain-containing protein [Staphylococcus sp. IVB6238]
MNNDNMLKLNIQFFSEDETTEETIDNGQENTEAEEKVKAYTEDEFNEKLQSELTRRLKQKDKEREEAVKEAEKLAKMTKDEKREHEFQQLQKELEDLRKRDTLSQMRKEASTILSDSGITANDALLDFIVTDTAQDTKERVEAFTTVFNSMLKSHVQKQLQQETPKIYKSTGMTREEILSIPDATKRQEAIARNLHLFN